MASEILSIDEHRPTRHPLLGLLVAQTIGVFNDNAWKQIAVLLAMAAVTGEAAKQGQAARAQVVLMVPLVLFSLPAGVLADRLSKRTVIVGLKAVEALLMLGGTAALFASGSPALAGLVLLGLLGVQAALFSPAKYGILPELVPHDRLSTGNGLLEMWTNLAIIGGTVAGGVVLWAFAGRPWLGGLFLSVLSVVGFAASLAVPRVPAARGEGGIASSVRMAWQAVRADRILGLAVIGQIVVWSIASVVPPPVLAYSKGVLGLEEWKTGLPLAALGIGIGIGCLLAAKLSAAKVEYGLLPMGALGLTFTTLGFGVIGPGFAGTIVLMGLIGASAGLLFVPLNALIQWRAPEECRGAVIALANLLVNGGMLVGSLVALATADGGLSARGTFLGVSVALAAATVWAFRLVPDAFFRFILVVLAGTIYRVRVLGREHVPAEGGALLTPNHVSFADGLFVIASIDRPVRFLVYAEYFKRPLIGRFLRAMRAIPISSSGGPRMILQAFREAGRSLDAGELVCIFPEGQLTRTGLTTPFMRGMERILKGRTTPVVPVHLDRVENSIFAPMHRSRIPSRIPLPVTVSFGEPMPPETPVFRVRQAIRDLDQEAWAYGKADRSPLHHDFIRQARRHPLRLGLADLTRPWLSMIGALAGSVALARALRPRWDGQENVGVILPASVGATMVNLAAALSGRAAVNLNFTTGRAALTSSARQAGLRTVVTNRVFLQKAKVELPDGVEPVWIEEARDAIGRRDRLIAFLLALFAPVRALERACGAARAVSVDDTAAIIFSSGSTGDPKGVVLSHSNVDSNLQAIAQVHKEEPGDRVMDVLPPFHSFGYMLMWLALNRGLSLVCHPNPLEAAAVGGLVERYAATVLMATPTFLNLYLRRVTPAQFGSLRLVLAGAEKVPEALDREFQDTFGVRLMEGYGATECAPVIAVSTFDHREPGYFQPGARRGYVGQPLPGISVRIVDPDTGEERGPNEPGMIRVKGPNVMKGYLGRPDLTDEVLRDGWYTTGDIGLLDNDGFLKITGRLSRFSKIGGEMVPHGRIEEALHQAIGARDEPVFAVTGVPDGRGGERLAVLYTVSDDQAREALAKLPEMGLPNLFLPRPDHMVKVDALPVLGTGKSDLRGVRRMAEEHLGRAA